MALIARPVLTACLTQNWLIVGKVATKVSARKNNLSSHCFDTIRHISDGAKSFQDMTCAITTRYGAIRSSFSARLRRVSYLIFTHLSRSCRRTCEANKLLLASKKTLIYPSPFHFFRVVLQTPPPSQSITQSFSKERKLFANSALETAPFIVFTNQPILNVINQTNANALRLQDK